MYKAIFLQLAAAAIGTALGALFFGLRGAISAALGGAAYCIPSLLFVVRLSANSRRSGAISYAPVFLMGEAIKIVTCIGLLAAIRFIYPEAEWAAVIIGLIVTLQANFFAFLLKT